MGESKRSLFSVCGKLVYPVKAPISTFHLVCARTLVIISTLCVFVVSCLSLIWHEWKIETLDGRVLEFGVWKICKYTPHEPPVVECYTEYYDHQSEEDVWFQAFRYLMLIGAIIQFLCLITMIALTTFKNEEYVKPWTLFASAFLLAGSMTFFSLIFFDVQFELGFAEDARVMMGWSEESEIEETMGYVYSVAWASFGGVWFNAYLCYYAKCTEAAFRKEKFPHKGKLSMEKQYILNGTKDNP